MFKPCISSVNVPLLHISVAGADGDCVLDVPDSGIMGEIQIVLRGMTIVSIETGDEWGASRLACDIF